MEKKLFDELTASLKEAAAIQRGEVPPSRQFTFENIDVKAIRNKMGISQSKFSAMIGVSLRTLQNWEQGHRKIQGPARALLSIYRDHPELLVPIHSR